MITSTSCGNTGTGFWRRLGQFAFALNALPLLGRFLATFAAQHWLDSFNT
jgi:hypothetical protein